MFDKLYFIYCCVFSFSGFVVGFYGIMAKHKIEMERQIGINKGIDIYSSYGRTYFTKKFEKWKAGSIFDSQIAPLIGVIISFTGAGLNFIYNSWWSSILLILLSYIFYLQLVKFIKWKIQVVSILTLLISTVLIIIKLV